MKITNTFKSPWESRWNLIAAKGLLRKLLGNVPNNGARVVPSTLNPQTFAELGRSGVSWADGCPVMCDRDSPNSMIAIVYWIA